MGARRVTGSTRLQNLAVRSVFFFSSMPTARGNKFMSIQNGHADREQGMLSVAGPTNTQKDSVESHNFSRQ
eukprot:93314-Pelagomonas_calceolata.AAC.2